MRFRVHVMLSVKRVVNRGVGSPASLKQKKLTKKRTLQRAGAMQSFQPKRKNKAIFSYTKLDEKRY